MSLLFVLLAAWVVGAVVVLAFLSGAQRLDSPGDGAIAREVNPAAPAEAMAQVPLKDAGARDLPRFRSWINSGGK
ncbi:MAG: hypothetical protein QNJ87_09300 [Gammaproteobacteria bacterium]|nr:hypothetical protein [Gammaproteobacteria bacterium]